MLSAYRPLFARAEQRRLVAASLLARAPIAGVDLPLILLARETSGSYAVAGLAVGVRAAAVALTAPVRGRLVDRHGTRRVVPPLVVASAVATGCLPAAGALDAAWLIVVLAALGGGLAPALPAAMRLEWQRMLRAEPARLERAYAFESTAQVGLYVIAPLAAGGAIAVGGPSAALLGAAVLLLAAGLVFAALARSEPHATAPSGRGLGPMLLPAVRRLVVAIVLADSARRGRRDGGRAGARCVLPRGQASSSSVTGPSLTSATFMRAPNTPPCAPSVARTRS